VGISVWEMRFCRNMKSQRDKLFSGYHKRRCSYDHYDPSTSLKLDARQDWEEEDSAIPVPRVHGKRKHRVSSNLDYDVVRRVLAANKGRNLDTVRSELLSTADARTAAGNDLRRMLKDEFTNPDIPFWRHLNFRTDAQNRIQEIPRKRYQKPVVAPDRVHWYDDVWFERRLIQRPPSEGCGCTRFIRVNKKYRLSDTPSWYNWRNEPMYYTQPDRGQVDYWVCAHGNLPVYDELWEVVTYTRHEPEAVYRVYEYNERIPDLNRQYGLKAPGDRYVLRYKDVTNPDALKPYEVYRKSCNHKELQILKGLLKQS
jgi:hypothetical protein